MKKSIIILLVFVITGLISTIGVITYLVLKDTSTKDSGTTVANEQNNGVIRTEDIIDEPETSNHKLTYTAPKLLSYPGLKFEYPETWTVKKDSNENAQMVYTISSDNYTLTINRTQGGGEECVLNDNFDPLTDFAIDISQYDYKEITAKAGTFYYYRNGDKYDFCSPNKDSKTKTYTLSDVGSITFKTPLNPDQKMVIEMVQIISSIEFL